MLKNVQRTRARWRRRTAAVTATRTRGSAAATEARTDAEAPEWTTERWKRRVEADARDGLERNIRGVGTAR
jgi:hypothetical protein